MKIVIKAGGRPLLVLASIVRRSGGAQGPCAHIRHPLKSAEPETAAPGAQHTFEESQRQVKGIRQKGGG